MEFYPLNFYGIKRDLPIISIAPKIKIASFNLLGDVEITRTATRHLATKLKDIDFDYLIGPEVKVVPLLYALSAKLKKSYFIVCRKSIKGYMISPLVFKSKFKSRLTMLVLDGGDASRIKGKKVAIIDDVVSSGSTLFNLHKLLVQAGAQVVAIASIFKQSHQYKGDLIYLKQLPVFDEN